MVTAIGFLATGVATNLDPRLWTGPCHRLNCGRPWKCGLLNLLQGRKEPGACGLKIAHDRTYAMICMHITLWGGVWPCNVFGALGLIYWGI